MGFKRFMAVFALLGCFAASILLISDWGNAASKQAVRGVAAEMIATEPESVELIKEPVNDANKQKILEHIRDFHGKTLPHLRRIVILQWLGILMMTLLATIIHIRYCTSSRTQYT